MSSTRAAELAATADDRLAEVLRRADAAPDAALGDAYLGRRVTDVLAHLHAWHVIFDGWIAQARVGSVPAYPAEGYTWRDLRALNDALFEAHRHRSYDAVRAMLVTSHRGMLALLQTFTEDELTDPHRYPWLSSHPLDSVANACLAAHYDWALGIFDAAAVA